MLHQATYKGKYDLPQKKSVWARFDSYRKADPETAKDGGLERKFSTDFEQRISKAHDTAILP